MYEPGKVYEGDGTAHAPIAVVTTSAQSLARYIGPFAIGPWVWVRTAADLPAGRLGGLAMLDTEPVDPELSYALLAAFN